LSNYHKSFYYAYYYTEAGGGFHELDFVTANPEFLKQFILMLLRTSPYLNFQYGVYLEVTRVENGVVTDDSITPFSAATITVEGIEAGFSYKAKKGGFAAKLKAAQKRKLQEFVEICENDPSGQNPRLQDMKITINWEMLKITALNGELAVEGDSLEKPSKFGIYHPIRTGSYFAGRGELELLTGTA
jgi:hypothetical protein